MEGMKIMPRPKKSALKDETALMQKKSIKQLKIDDIEKYDASAFELVITDSKYMSKWISILEELKCRFDVNSRNIKINLGNSWKGLILLLGSVWVCFNSWQEIIEALRKNISKKEIAQYLKYFIIDNQYETLANRKSKGEIVDELPIPYSRGHYYLSLNYKAESIYYALILMVEQLGISDENSSVTLLQRKNTQERYKSRSFEVPGSQDASVDPVVMFIEGKPDTIFNYKEPSIIADVDLDFTDLQDNKNDAKCKVNRGLLYYYINRVYVAHPIIPPAEAVKYIKKLESSPEIIHLAYPLIWEYHLELYKYFPKSKNEIKEFSKWAQGYKKFDIAKFDCNSNVNYIGSGHNFIAIDLDRLSEKD